MSSLLALSASRKDVTVPGSTHSLRNQLTMRLEVAPEHLEQIRHTIRACLEMWACGDLGDLAALAATELLGNVYKHAESNQATLLVQRIADGICIVVSDRDRRMPVVKEPDWDSQDGRGLFLLTHTVTNWGIAPTPIGKDVWVTLHSNGDAPAEALQGAARKE